MKLRRILAGIATAMLIGAGSVVATVAPAQAASAWIIVCNSSISWTSIKVVGGPTVSEGSCTGNLANGSNQVRVDTDPSGASHSYWTTYDNLPHGSCHTNSDNHSSDPSNYSKVTYRNFDHGNCTN